MKSNAAIVPRFQLLGTAILLLAMGFSPFFSEIAADQADGDGSKIICERIEGEIAKIRCRYHTQSAPQKRKVVFTWRSPTSPQDDRNRTLVLPAGHRSVFDERYLYGRAPGEWNISVTAEGERTHALYLLDEERNLYEKERATTPLSATVPKKRRLSPPAASPLSEQCTFDDLAIDIAKTLEGETVLRVMTAKDSREWPVGSGIYDASLTFQGSDGNRYTAIRYKKAENAENAAVLATSCEGKIVLSSTIEGYIEKTGSDELLGIDPSVNNALCNTRPCRACRTDKPALYKLAGIKDEGISLEALSVEASVATALGEKKYREYFKQVRFNMSVALYSEKLDLDSYLSRLPKNERAFCEALYAEKAFSLLVPIYSQLAGSMHK